MQISEQRFKRYGGLLISLVILFKTTRYCITPTNLISIIRTAMLIRIIILLASFFFSGFLSAQDFTTLETTIPKARKKFVEGRTHLERGQTTLAQSYLEQTLELDSSFLDAWLLMGECYVDLKNYHYAEMMFQEAVELAPEHEPKIYLRLAKMEWRLEQHRDALEHLKMFLDRYEDEGRLRNEALGLKIRAEFVINAMENPVPFNPQPLDTTVNSRSDEYFPVITADGQTLIFTRREPLYQVAGSSMVISDENFYSASKDGDSWGEAVELEGVNTDQNEGAQSISADGSWLAFTACNRRGDGSQGSCDIYWSQKRETGWTTPRPFSATINSSEWDSHPCISADGKSLYFSSGRKGGKGNADIWVTHRQSNGKWTKPENLGDVINTRGHENSPFFHPDGKTMYFSSDGHLGMGGFDLYMTRQKEDGSWEKPINLGYPINTSGNEQTLFVALDGKTAYYALEKKGKKADIDIVSFTLPENVRANPATYVKVRVRDANTGYPIKAVAKLENLTRDKTFAHKYTKKDGTLLVCIPVGQEYAFHVSKEGYLFHSEHFSLTEMSTFDKPLLLTIDLVPLQPDAMSEAPSKPSKPIVLNNVFFRKWFCHSSARVQIRAQCIERPFG